MKDFYAFIFFLVGMVFLFQILKFKLGMRSGSAAASLDWHNDPRARSIENELRDLRARVKTLERIAVEKENSLAREIEDLRGR